MDTLESDGAKADNAVSVVESRMMPAASVVAESKDCADDCDCALFLTPRTRNETGARAMSGAVLNTAVRTPPTRLEVADAPGGNPVKSVTGNASEADVKPVIVTTNDLKLEILVGVKEIVRVAKESVNAGCIETDDSRSDWNIGPHATLTDLKVSIDVENTTPSKASTPLRARPIFKPDTVIVKAVPANILTPPATELRVVRTRLRSFKNEAAADRNGILLDPGSVAFNATEVSKNDAGYCTVMLPPLGSVVEGTNEKVAETPERPSMRS